MSIADKDIKLLWALAAGRCSEPGCHKDLTLLLPKSGWELEVKTRLLPRISVNHGSAMEMRLWTYFNFDLILKLLNHAIDSPMHAGDDMIEQQRYNL